MSLVSVICLCYNHASYVEEAVDSVFNQTYKEIELIIVDDASSDASVDIINRLSAKYPGIKLILHTENRGMCRSFNEALSLAKGEFIIDLAADDILLSERVSEQVAAFKKISNVYGVVFSDAYICDEKKTIHKTFYTRNYTGTILEKVPEGNVFIDVIKSYRICSPTMMIRKEVLDELGGYDESLSYEDYDFFVRSSRNYKYYFIDKPLMLKREINKSNSSGFYKTKINEHLRSTLIVCKKALWLCKNEEEIKSLLFSIRYHFRQSVFMGDFITAKKYYELLVSIKKTTLLESALFFIIKNKINLNSLYMVYLTISRRMI